MPILPKVVTRRAPPSSKRTIKRPDAAVAPLIARAAQLSARLASAIDTAVPIRTTAAVNEDQVRVAAADITDRHGLSVWQSNHQTQSAGGYPFLHHDGYSFCQSSWLLVDMTVAFTDHHVVERQSTRPMRQNGALGLNRFRMNGSSPV
jgi:hypothetical protein